MSLQTEYTFTLPKGFVDSDGTVHTAGSMRLATARDEIEPLRDRRVQENDAYLTVIILSRVVTKLGSVADINPKVIEGMFASDIAYLQDLYGVINFGDPESIAALNDAPFAKPEVEEVPVGVA